MPHRRPAVVTLTLIVACVLVFLYELSLSTPQLDALISTWGAVPARVLPATRGAPGAGPALATLFTSQFLHAGWLHLGGNMVFLWVFGRAVEDRVGHAVYLLLYLIGGAVAGLAQSFVAGDVSTPLIGASGAIATVLGAYFIFFPRAWVTVLLPIFFFFWAFDLPALLVLAFWFLTQFFNGAAAITEASGATSGVAVWAHVAGFLEGAVFALVAGRAIPQAPGRSVAVRRRDNVPGPAHLISSVANLVALFLVARLVIVYLGWIGGASPAPTVTQLVLGVTRPLVLLFAGILPVLRLAGGLVELATVAALVLVYVLAGLLANVLAREPDRV